MQANCAPLCCSQDAFRLLQLQEVILSATIATGPCKVNFRTLQPCSPAVGNLRIAGAFQVEDSSCPQYATLQRGGLALALVRTNNGLLDCRCIAEVELVCQY